MVHLIDKSALVAWAKETYLCENASMVRKVCYKQLLEHLDTLEVRGVELKKEIKEYIDDEWSDEWSGDVGNWIRWRRGTSSMTVKDVKDIAKHFFEFGLKVAQKRE